MSSSSSSSNSSSSSSSSESEQEEKKQKPKKFMSESEHLEQKKKNKNKIEPEIEKRQKVVNSASDIKINETPQIKMIESNTNPLTNKPYTPRYYDILAKRKELPAWEARDKVVSLVTAHQVLIL